MAKELTQERLKEALDYDPETGVFTWKIRTSIRIVIGAVAGWTDKKGYVCIGLDDTLYRAHRLAWLYTYGTWASKDVDHRDGNPSNNSLRNLREANQVENQQNRSSKGRGKHGKLGVTIVRNSKKNPFRAQITHERKAVNLGNFPTAELAHAAYLEAKKRLHLFNPIPRD